MWRPSVRTGGPLLALGAVCLVVGTLPLEFWPGPHPGDSYVFDPPRFSGIWVERTLTPVLGVGANVSILVGLYALYRRDTNSMPRWQRVSAIVALFGTSLWLLGTYLLTSAGSGASLGGIFAVLLLGCGLLLAGPCLIAWGAGYLRSERPYVGAALAGTPLLTVGYTGISLSGFDPGSVGGLLFVAPTVAMSLVVGYDLWTDTTPLVSDWQTEP